MISQDVLGGSERSAVLQLTNLVEVVYTFHLRVSDSHGSSDMDTATVAVQPDPKKNGLVELILQVGVGQLTEQQKKTLVGQLAVLLDVPGRTQTLRFRKFRPTWIPAR